MALRIPASVQQKMGYYVYLYIDRRDGSVFYVGKGKGERALSHLKDTAECEKVERIAELTKLGLTPRLDILRYGLSAEEALHVEASAIELLGIDVLTNKVLGHSFDLKRRSRLEDLIQELDAKEVKISHPSVLINISQMYHYGMSPIELYDATRKSWVVGLRRDQVQFALAVYRGIVREVYEIATWLPAGSTMSFLGTVSNVSEPIASLEPHPSNRFEFVGRLADDKIRQRYLGKSVRDYFPASSQNPIRYAP